MDFTLFKNKINPKIQTNMLNKFFQDQIQMDQFFLFPHHNDGPRGGQ